MFASFSTIVGFAGAVSGRLVASARNSPQWIALTGFTVWKSEILFSAFPTMWTTEIIHTLANTIGCFALLRYCSINETIASDTFWVTVISETAPVTIGLLVLFATLTLSGLFSAISG